jgi:hypothetical protein
MTRRADPARIDVARREAALARLIGTGHGRDGATRLIAAWLDELGRPPGREDWEALDRWVVERRSAAGLSSRRAPRSASSRPCR